MDDISERIAFAGIDMNSVPPEVVAMAFLRARLVLEEIRGVERFCAPLRHIDPVTAHWTGFDGVPPKWTEVIKL